MLDSAAQLEQQQVRYVKHKTFKHIESFIVGTRPLYREWRSNNCTGASHECSALPTSSLTTLTIICSGPLNFSPPFGRFFKVKPIGFLNCQMFLRLWHCSKFSCSILLPHNSVVLNVNFLPSNL